MPIPRSEAEVVEALQLGQFEAKFPVPENEPNSVIRLDGKEFSQEAIRAALEIVEATVLRELAEYPDQVFSHNNRERHGGAGGQTSLMRALLFSATSELRTQMFGMLENR